MKRLGVFILPPGWDASPSQGYPQHYAGTHLYTWVERGTVRVKCLAQEHNTMSPARPRTQPTRSGVEHPNHEATAPPFLTPLQAKLMILLEKPTYFHYPLDPKKIHAEGSIHKDTTYQGSNRQDFYRHGKKKPCKNNR